MHSAKEGISLPFFCYGSHVAMPEVKGKGRQEGEAIIGEKCSST
jgi:hypothetical protein